MYGTIELIFLGGFTGPIIASQGIIVDAALDDMFHSLGCLGTCTKKRTENYVHM